MARDKLITIRIESEKREAFNQLAKSQNTDTASLLYDFISGCLDGRIDIQLVTGKKQWIDKIDNQIDNNRIDRLEATTQRIDGIETTTQRLDNRIDGIETTTQRLDNRIDGIETTTQRLDNRIDDWIEAIDDRVSDCDQGLSEKITSLEHRLNALSIQLDSQKIDSEIDRIDTDRQEIDDMDQLLKLQREASIADHSQIPSSPPAIEPAIEAVTPEVSPSPPGTDAIELAIKPAIASIDGTVTGAIEYLAREPIPKTHTAIAKELGLKSPSSLTYWLKKGEIPSLYEDRVKFSPDKKKIVWIG